MSKVVVVTSGKGRRWQDHHDKPPWRCARSDGQKVVVVDFDVGLRNLDLVMGAERRVVFDLINSCKGRQASAGLDPPTSALTRSRCCRPRRRATRMRLARRRRARDQGAAHKYRTGSSATAPPASSAAPTLAMRSPIPPSSSPNPEVSSVRDPTDHRPARFRRQNGVRRAAHRKWHILESARVRYAGPRARLRPDILCPYSSIMPEKART